MSRNNTMYEMFKKMKQGYAEGNLDMVEQCARCWLQLSPENPFSAETPEHEAFFQMQRCYTIWSRGDVNRKINMRKMRQYAIALCELNPRQPYRFDKLAYEEETRIAKEAEQTRVEKAVETPKEEPVVLVKEPKAPVEKEYVFGVIPEEKVEKKSWIKNLFHKKKE